MKIANIVTTAVLGAAVIDDVLSIVMLTIILGLETLVGSVLLTVGIISFKIILFFFIFLYLGLRIIERILDISEHINLPKAFLSISYSNISTN